MSIFLFFEMTRFKNKYRIESIRAQWWDYGSNAAYFITICTKNQEHYFGKIVDGEQFLSPLGEMAEVCWYEIPNHFPFVELGAFVVMPDHIHGIIIIDKPISETQNLASPEQKPKITNEDNNQHINQTKNKFGPQSRNLASIVRGYKVGVTKQSKIHCPEFKWQALYHDRIIRSETDYHFITNYIETNPKNWGKKKIPK